MEESLFREAKHSYLRIVGGIEPRLRPDFAFDGHKRSCASSGAIRTPGQAVDVVAFL